LTATSSSVAPATSTVCPRHQGLNRNAAHAIEELVALLDAAEKKGV
jgi:hypothetical protein